MPLRRLACISVLIALLAGLFGLFWSSTASAASGAVADEAAAGANCAKAERDDDTIHVRVCLRDRRGNANDPVPGVSVSVETLDGTPIGETVTDADGLADIDLGNAIDVLGNQYRIKIDTDTLPEGTALQNPKDVERVTQKLQLQTDYAVTFPIDDEIVEPSNWDLAVNLLATGLVYSSILAMASLGLNMVFGTTGLTNFAHGELMTFGALIAFAIDSLPGSISIAGHDFSVVVACLVGFLASGIFGWLNDKGLWLPLRRRGTGVIAMMIVSIGLSIFLRNLYQYFAGGQNHNYSQYTNISPMTFGPLQVTSLQITVFIVSVTVLVVACLLLQYTRLGKATRAVADNPALAASSGINVERVINRVWVFGAALAGLSGALLGVTQGFNYQVGYKALLMIFAAVCLGGLGTVWGAIAGAFVIGIFIELSTLVVPDELKYVGALGVLIVVLMVRPQGILGRRERIG
ncbi:branched-chain amino acid ABC transporter permease [Nocardioides daejeonensis]|uniref:branched-chain amino acid ABC transporter permease n=1 Tax=Nocardioides daejeonensis TaxID=1046556 RepID=UPI0013A5828E|nr:branched-chain amino acid ABC transporter permease [Nocardioides daejeonensis]